MAGATSITIPQALVPIIENAGGIVGQIWRRFFESIVSSITTLTTAVNAVPGVNVFTVATQPALGAGDAGTSGS
jgi:hypothetical protein